MLSLHVVCAIMASTPAEQVARISIPYDSNGHPTAMTFGFWNKAANTSICLVKTAPPILYQGTWAQAPPAKIGPQGGTQHSHNPGFRALALASPVRGTYINGTMNFKYGAGHIIGHISMAFAALTRAFLAEVRWGGCSVRTQSYNIGSENVYMLDADLHESGEPLSGC